MGKGPRLSGNSFQLIMTGEKAKKQERVEKGRGGWAGPVSSRAVQAAVRIPSLSQEKQGEWKDFK